MNKKGASSFLIGLIVMVILAIILLSIYLIYFNKSSEEVSQNLEENATTQQETITEEPLENITDNETEEIIAEELFPDLEAISLTLTSNGCDEDDNGTLMQDGNCTISLTGTIENSGDKDINAQFTIQLLDTTDSSSGSYISAITLDSLAISSEQSISASYEAPYRENRFFQLRVDPANKIKEKDENNNILSKAIRLP